MEGQVDYFGGSDIYFAFYKDGKETTDIPTKTSGYTLDEIRSNCDKGASIEWNKNQNKM